MRCERSATRAQIDAQLSYRYCERISTIARFHLLLGSACPPVCHASAWSLSLVWTSVTVYFFIHHAVLVALIEEEVLDLGFTMY